MLVGFVEFHQLGAIHQALLVERDELDLFWRQCLVCEGTFDGVIVVRPNGN